jgi:thymidylate synthase
VIFMTLSPFNVVEETNFANAWVKAVKFVMKKKHEIVFGIDKKVAYDSKQMIILTGNAIRQIENREFHPDFPFKLADQYCEELTREFLNKYWMKPIEEKFAYLYFERLSEYGDDLEKAGLRIDQLVYMRNNLRSQIERKVLENTCQAITWVPKIDIYQKATPCLQRLQVRYCGDGLVDVALDWRSRDLFGAWQVNIIAIVNMLNLYVLKPNNCKIDRLSDSSFSLHVYRHDWDAAGRVELVPVSPMEMGR